MERHLAKRIKFCIKNLQYAILICPDKKKTNESYIQFSGFHFGISQKNVLDGGQRKLSLEQDKSTRGGNINPVWKQSKQREIEEEKQENQTS